MSVCIGCLVSTVTAGGVWAFGKAHEWHAERERRRAYDELEAKNEREQPAVLPVDAPTTR